MKPEQDIQASKITSDGKSGPKKKNIKACRLCQKYISSSNRTRHLKAVHKDGKNKSKYEKCTMCEKMIAGVK